MKWHREIGTGLLTVGLVMILTSCSLDTLLPPIPTDIAIPTVTIVPSATPVPIEVTATLTLTPTGISPAQAGTRLPQAAEAVTANNASRLQPFAWQGRGIPSHLALSRDGSLLAVSTTRGVFIFDPAALTELHRFETSQVQLVLAFSPRGDSVASAGVDGMISLWQVQDGRLLRQFNAGLYTTVTALAFSPDGARLVSTGMDRVTHIWQVADGTEEDPILDNARIVRLLSFAADSSRLFSWAPVEPVKVWNLDTHQKVRDIAVNSDDLGNKAINGVFSADGAVFAANTGLRVRVYSTRTGYTLQLLHLKEPAVYLLLSDDGSQLCVVAEKQLYLYQVGSKNDPLILPLPVDFLDAGGSAFTADGAALLWLDQGLSRWTLAQNSQSTSSITDFVPDYILASAFLDDPPVTLQVMLDGTLQTRDRAGLLEKSIHLDETGLNAAAISADGSRLATSAKQNGLVTWSADGKLQQTLASGTANDLSFSTNGLLAAAMADGRVVVWQADGGNVRLAVKMEDIPQQVLLSSDGKMLAARTSAEVFWWDISGSAARQVGRYAGYGMALSNDGQLLAVSRFSDAGQMIEIHSPISSDPLSVLNAGGAWMTFSPDSSLLAVGGDPLVLWHVRDGAALVQLPAGGLWGRPFFLNQGKLLALLGWDGGLRLWGIP